MQVGQGGNLMGTKFWGVVSDEHGAAAESFTATAICTSAK
jgi:hypothetical protein